MLFNVFVLGVVGLESWEITLVFGGICVVLGVRSFVYVAVVIIRMDNTMRIGNVSRE